MSLIYSLMIVLSKIEELNGDEDVTETVLSQKVTLDLIDKLQTAYKELQKYIKVFASAS